MCPFVSLSDTMTMLPQCTIVNATSIKNKWDTIHLNMYELICIDYLCIFVVGNPAEEEGFSPVYVFKQNVIYKAEISCRCADKRLYK